MNVSIERITINLHGISATVVEAAVEGLEAELRRRLGVLRAGDLSAFDAAELALPPVKVRGTVDAPVLRGLIVERIVQALITQPPSRLSSEEH